MPPRHAALIFVFAAAAPAVAAPLDFCEALLRQGEPRPAADCFDGVATSPAASDEDRAVALELAAAARAMMAPRPAPERRAGEPVSVTGVVESGAPELIANSAAFGGVAGFLAAGAVLSALRLDEGSSLPWLIGAPAFGIVAGGAAATAASLGLRPDAGDAALLSSSMWVGTAWGIGLQLAAYDQRDDVGHIPLRFAAVLGTGAAVTALGALGAWQLEVDPGDVGLMNSGALWGAVLGGLSLTTVVNVTGADGLTFPVVTAGLIASSALPWVGLFALHPLFDVPRPATWLIEAGGIGGLLVGGALLALFSRASLGQGASFALLTASTGLGVASGTAAAFLIAEHVRGLDLGELTRSRFSLAPVLLPPVPGRPEALAPALSASWRF